MSVSYTTNSAIPYEDFLRQTTLELREPTREVFTTPSKVIHENGSFIHVRRDEFGNCEFTRFGGNDIHKVFPQIIQAFNVEIIDEYGMTYPDCLD